MNTDFCEIMSNVLILLSGPTFLHDFESAYYSFMEFCQSDLKTICIALQWQEAVKVV